LITKTSSEISRLYFNVEECSSYNIDRIKELLEFLGSEKEFRSALIDGQKPGFDFMKVRWLVGYLHLYNWNLIYITGERLLSEGENLEKKLESFSNAGISQIYFHLDIRNIKRIGLDRLRSLINSSQKSSLSLRFFINLSDNEESRLLLQNFLSDPVYNKHHVSSCILSDKEFARPQIYQKFDSAYGKGKKWSLKGPIAWSRGEAVVKLVIFLNEFQTFDLNKTAANAWMSLLETQNVDKTVLDLKNYYGIEEKEMEKDINKFMKDLEEDEILIKEKDCELLSNKVY